MKKLFEKKAHTNEIDDLDISPDNKQVVIHFVGYFKIIYIYIYRFIVHLTMWLDFLFIRFLLQECQGRVLEQIFTTGCPSWRQPHMWDAI